MNDQVNEATRSALAKDGYIGQLNQMLTAWLRTEGAVGYDLMSLWLSFFDIKLIADGQFNERMQGWLTSEGFGYATLSDSQLGYWRNRANTP